LVVGIDEYSNGGPEHLQGCVNDSNAFADYLFGHFKQDKQDQDRYIKHLKNSEATRKAILDAFQDHLIDNPYIKVDDPVIFYFAGHGGRQKTNREGWVAHQNKVELICPYDIASAHGIPDYTLAALLRRLEAKKGQNIVSLKCD
jgi:uncharacterized caspase-like protein